MSVRTIVLSREELLIKRDGLLASTHMTYDELRSLAENFDLRLHERGAYEGIETIDWLLGEAPVGGE